MTPTDQWIMWPTIILIVATIVWLGNRKPDYSFQGNEIIACIEDPDCSRLMR